MDNKNDILLRIVDNLKEELDAIDANLSERNPHKIAAEVAVKAVIFSILKEVRHGL